MSLFDCIRVVFVLALLAPAAPAPAVVEAKMPLPTIYGVSKAVIVATVQKFNVETGDVDAVANETINGEGFGGPCRIAVAVPEIRPRIAAGQSVVILLSKGKPKDAVLHLGDTWVLAEYDATRRLPYFIARGLKADFSHTFPGTTDTLIAIIRELKESGKSALLDKVDPKTFDGVRSIGRLPLTKPQAVVAGDFDGDKTMDMAVATSDGVQVFTLTMDGLQPSKANPPKDFPPRPRPAAGAAADERPLAAAIDSFGPGGELSAIVVRKASIVREHLDARADQPVRSDPLTRLTGDETKVYFPESAAGGIEAAIAASIDINGDGRRDVFIATPAAAVVLINRGYGAFFVVPRVKEILAKDGKYLFPVDQDARLTSVDSDGDKREELLVVGGDGTVYLAR